MGFFQGNIANAYHNNHVFIILDKHFQDYGVGSLTKSGYEEFVKTSFGKQVVLSRTSSTTTTTTASPGGGGGGGGSPTIPATIMDALDLTDIIGKYHKYDGSKYTETSIYQTELMSLIDYHESGNAQIDTNKDPSKDQQIKDIKNSLEGYVGFKNSDDKLVLKCYFNGVGKGKNDRVVTQKGSPLITATPRLPSGRKVSYRNSQNARLEVVNGFPSVGTFVDATKGGDNDIDNVVTGPLRLSWNEVTGSWESANQQIARLLTDLEPANIVGVNLTDEDLNNAANTTYFDPSSEKYLGQRKTGKAMPLSVQSSNPDMFGPNLIRCDGSKRVEEISVVNRSNDSFKAGDIVLCSFISGEWIVQKFGSLETKPQPTSIGRWGFTKLIANSDWYFRDTDGALTLPATCQDLLKAKFYASLLDVNSAMEVTFFSKQEISTLNSVGTFTGVGRKLNYYIQTTSFDNSGPTKGGTGTQDFYSRINVEQPAFNDTISYYQTPIFWGPVFPDGYSSNGYARMKANANFFSGWKHTGISTASSGTPEANSGNYFFANNTIHTIQEVPNLNVNDSNFLQLPADIATNGKYGGDGFPIEDTHKIIQAINNSDAGFAQSINNLINNQGFAYYLGQINSPADMYALKPVNPLKLQFSPLCAELAGSDDANSPNLSSAYLFDRNFQKNARDALKNETRYDAVAGEAIPATTSLFGNLYTRLASFGLNNLTTITPVKCGGVYENALIGQFQGIPYDCYISKTPLNKPKASTTVFRSPVTASEDGANLVGIIAARNSFTKNKGGTFNVSLKQMFGMYGNFLGNGAGGSIAVTILGSIGAWTTDNTSSFKARYSPIWGSTNSDSIDSFGTTALHCMVWDYWPEQQTIFIPQYFSVLHFNPGVLFSYPRTRVSVFRPETTGTTTTSAPDASTTTPPPINIDIADYDVDFRIPSYNAKWGDGGYVPVSDGAVITFSNKLAPESDWRINTVRRGQLVTNEGFFYYKLVIGLNKDSATINTAGQGFSVGDKIDAAKGVVIEVTAVDSNGGISGFNFAIDTSLEGKIKANVSLPRKQGEGFKHTDFQNPYKLTIKSPTNKQSAIIEFTSGKAYKQIKQDVGPKMRTPITRLSSSSGEGTARVEETKNTTLNIEDNTGSKYPNKYEAFYFFHNDISHTFNMAEVDSNPNFTQYMTMTIS